MDIAWILRAFSCFPLLCYTTNGVVKRAEDQSAGDLWTTG